MGQGVFQLLPHRWRVEFIPVVRIRSSYFRQAGAVGEENRFAEAHGLHGGQAESLGEGREQKGLAMVIKPGFLRLTDVGRTRASTASEYTLDGPANTK